VVLERGPRYHLDLEIPPSGLRGPALSMALFALLWNGFLVVWTGGALVAAFSGAWFFPLFSIPFWAVGIGITTLALRSALGHTHLKIDRDRLTFRQRFWRWERVQTGSPFDLEAVELRTAYTQNHRPVHVITLVAGPQVYKFGTMLSATEKDWLVAELEDSLLDLPVR
jgi:hypothetical protein